MSTHAVIARRQDDDSYESVYLHFDGYPENARRALGNHFATCDRVDELLAKGDLRSLDGDTGAAEWYGDIEPIRRPAIKSATLADLIDLAQNQHANHLYVFEHDQWSHTRV